MLLESQHKSKIQDEIFKFSLRIKGELFDRSLWFFKFCKYYEHNIPVLLIDKFDCEKWVINVSDHD